MGARVRYVLTFEGQWLACWGWSAPARHLKPRDQWIGWSADQLSRRRHLLANKPGAGESLLVDLTPPVTKLQNSTLPKKANEYCASC